MSKTIVLDRTKLDARKRALLERASAATINAIIECSEHAEKAVLYYEKIRELTLKDGFTMRETKELIGIICDKVSLSPYYKKKLLFDTVYPPGSDKAASQARAVQRWNDPLQVISKKDFYKAEETIIRISKDQLSTKDLMHVARTRDEYLELKFQEGKFVNIRADTGEWVISEDYE